MAFFDKLLDLRIRPYRSTSFGKPKNHFGRFRRWKAAIVYFLLETFHGYR